MPCASHDGPGGTAQDSAAYAVGLAAPGDDSGIRRLLRVPVPGAVSLSYEREPSYASGVPTYGSFAQTIVLRHGTEVGGVLVRSVRPMWVNGRVEEVGYLGGLRIGASHRARWMLSRGMRYLRDLDGDGRVPFYLAALTDENRAARGLLVRKPRPGFLAFTPVARLRTLALLLHKGHPRTRIPPPFAEIVAFLDEHSRGKQFFPHLTEADLLGDRTRGFDPMEDFVAVREGGRGGRLVGVAGLWDQSSFKQAVVRGYGGWLRRVRPAYNATARLVGARGLPEVGEPLDIAYASFLCAAGNDPSISAALLRLLAEEAARRGHSSLIVGFAEGDPVLRASRRRPHVAYRSTLYAASWSRERSPLEKLDARLAHAEPAIL